MADKNPPHFAENSGAEQKPKKRGRPRGRAFKKGQSGNPGGRPKEAKELREALLAHGDELILKLLEQVEAGNVQALLKALEWVLGKPVQPLSGADGSPVEVVVRKYGEEEDDAP